MLYTVAFAFGRHAAAKLVEFAFFLATIPLIFRVGRRLGATDLACLVAAVFYFCAPVAGITGSSSYNDAAGVFFMLAAFYLLLLADPATCCRPACSPDSVTRSSFPAFSSWLARCSSWRRSGAGSRS